MANEAARPTTGRRWIGALLIALGVLASLALGTAWMFGLVPEGWFDGGPLAEARVAERRGDWSEVARVARQVTRADPKNLEARTLLARSSARLGQHALAVGQYKGLAAEALEPQDDRLLAASLLALDPRNAPLARGSLEAALSKAPNDPETVRDLARLLASQGNLDGAIRRAEQLAGIPGWEARGWLLAGIWQSKGDDPKRAVWSLREALKFDPKLTDGEVSPTRARVLLAEGLLRLGEGRDAEGVLAEVWPDAESSWLLSRAKLQQGDAVGTLEALKKAGTGRDPLASEPAPYVGAESCATCHPSQARDQHASRHARTFRQGAELAGIPLPDKAINDPNLPGVLHTFEHADSMIKAASFRGDQAYQALVEFALGSGDRGMTLLGRDNQGATRELRMSRYDNGRIWDVTTGHIPMPADHAEALGKAMGAAELARCIGCHTTVPGAAGDPARDVDAAAGDAQGIRCERCHGPAGNHLKAVELKLADPAIARPSKASGAAINRLCGQCHSPGHPVDPALPASARYQAETLPASRCVTGSNGQLSCVTCHNPHRDAETSAVAYESKCLSCHASEVEPAMTKASLCPINARTGCIQCHMPRVHGAAPHSTFTDHFIRVHPERGGR